MGDNHTEAEILDQEVSDQAALKDGLENLIANMGTEQDKRSHSKFVNNKNLSQDGGQTELNAMYRTDWLCGKVVDIIPDDMTREWRQFTGDMEPELVKTLTDEEDRLQVSFKFNLAHKWARLYGTAFIVMSVDDGQTPDMPLDISKIREGGLRHMQVIDRHRVSTSDVVPIADPMEANFGMPEFYRINDTSVRIHHSRMLRFDGVLLPFDEFRRNSYNSDSVLSRLYEAVTDFNTVTSGSSSMVYETNVDIVKVKGLMGYLQTADGENLLRKRFAMASMMKSFNNMLLLDNEEAFETKNNTFAGLPDLLDRFSLFLSAASDIPATRLLGSSASGFNATGEGDLKNYYDTVRSAQKQNYKPKLDYFDQIMAASLGVDEDLEYEFNSLFQMTPKEIADLQYTNAQRDQIYLQEGVISEEIVVKELKQTETYTNITDEFIEQFEEFENGVNTDPDASESGVKQEAPEGEEAESQTSETD
tara:strand:+ start:11351 stop:12778 length:1428 start_codon:yes stop_codon:yes gene_type:complete